MGSKKQKQNPVNNTTVKEEAYETPQQKLYLKEHGLHISLKALQDLQKEQREEGFRRTWFFLGVLHVISMCYLLGAYPQHYWFYYLGSFTLIAPIRIFQGVKKQLNYYILEFCWINTFSAVVFAVFAFSGNLSPEYINQMLKIYFCLGCGPQGIAILLFKNQLVFHSLWNICSLTIHLPPVIISYYLRWHFNTFIESYPTLLPLNDVESVIYDLFFPSLITYGIWWSIYFIWNMTHGYTLPDKGFDTAFNWTYTQVGYVQEAVDYIAYLFAKQTKKQQTKFKVVIYMFINLIVVITHIFWGIICYNYFYVHLIFLTGLVLYIIYQGSSHYAYVLLFGPQKTIERLITENSEDGNDSSENEKLSISPKKQPSNNNNNNNKTKNENKQSNQNNEQTKKNKKKYSQFNGNSNSGKQNQSKKSKKQ